MRPNASISSPISSFVSAFTSTSTSPSASFLIIDIDGTQYLIGAGEQRTDILKEFETPVVIDAGQTSGGRFKEVLKSYLGKGKES
ncbi:MAG: flagellar biosynthetic protein FliO [Anaerovoracaceae bacterium]|jgi:flagellar biogenesis protein FliO